MIKDANSKWRNHGRGPAGTLQRHGKRNIGRSDSHIQTTLCHMVDMASLGLIVDSKDIENHPCVGEGVYSDPVGPSWPCQSLGQASISDRRSYFSLPPVEECWSVHIRSEPFPMMREMMRSTRPAEVLDLQRGRTLYWRNHKEARWFPVGVPGTVARVKEWQSGSDCECKSGVLVQVLGYGGWRDLGWFRADREE